jgi:hypothetical protein
MARLPKFLYIFADRGQDFIHQAWLVALLPAQQQGDNQRWHRHG